MSAMYIIKDALEKAGFATKAEGAEKEEPVAKTAVLGHVAMDAVRRALDAAAPWWQSQGAEPKNGERIVNSPVEKETRPTALGAGKHMEAMQRKAGSRPPIGELPDTPKGMAGDEAIAEDALVMDEGETGAEVQKMMSELEAHDKKNHPGGYKGGRCKLRDKISKAAKNLGMQNNVIQGIVGAKKGAAGAGNAGGTEKVETKEEVAVTETIDPNGNKAGAGGGEGGAGGGEAEAPEVPDEAEKAFKEKMDAIMSKYREERAAAVKAKDNAKLNRLVDKVVKQRNAARMEYLTNALNMSPAEAGACAEIAQKVDEGSPEAKKVIEELAQNPNLTDQQKAAVEVVQEGNAESAGGETPAPESAGSTETAAPAGGSATPAAEPTDAQFEDELKKAFPDKAEMVDTLSQKFDGLNTSLNDDQKKKFWELNEGGDEAAFYTFLGDECGFSADEVSALRDLTDAYRAANPNDYPEYAKQHQYDALRNDVFGKNRRLKYELAGNGSRKPLSAQGLAVKLEGLGLDKKQIVDFMKSEGINEELATAIVNGDPIDPELEQKEAERIAAKDQLAKKKANLENAEIDSKEKYNRARAKAEKDGKLGDPDTVKKLKKLYDKWKAARDAHAAFEKNPDPDAPTAAPASEATAQAEGTANAETGAGGEKAETSSPAPTAKATAEEVSAQPKEDPVSEGTTPEDHAKVCKANPKSNCPFLKAHMAPEALAALDKPEGAQPAATGETATTAPATGETAAPATGTAQPTAEPSAGTVPPDSSGGETAAPAAENTKPSTETAAPAAETEAAPPPLPAPAAEPLPEYTVPKVNGQEVELSDEEQKYLDDLRNAYANEPSAEKRAEIEAEYNQFTADLDAQAAMLQAQADVEKDARAQEMEKKQPGFIQNMKDFFGGMLKSLKGDKPIGFELSPEERRDLGLPETGTIRQSEYRAANARAIARENARKAEEANKGGGKSGGKGRNEEEVDEEEQKIAAEFDKADAVHENGGVTTSTGTPYTPANDEFLDRTASKRGGLSDKDAVSDKIKSVLVQSNLSSGHPSVKEGLNSTTFSFPVGKQSQSHIKGVADDIIIGLARGVNENKQPNVLVTYDKEGGGNLIVTVRHNEDERANVSFADVLDTDEWKNAIQEGDIPFFVGMDEDRKPVIADLEKLTHLLIGGSTNMGKSARLHAIIASALMAKSPDDVKFIMVDAGKGGAEFSAYGNDPHMAMPVVSSAEQANKAVNWAAKENQNRLKLFAKVRAATGNQYQISNVKEYNDLAKEGKIPKDFPQKLPQMVMVIDEYADLMADKDFSPDAKANLELIARKARSQGIHLILATQRPDAKSIDGTLKNNIPARLAVRTSDGTASRTILDANGAEDLTAQGPFILKTPKGEFISGTGAYISGKEIGKFQQEVAKANGKSASSPTPKPPANPNAPQPVPKDKRSSPTHIANMPDGMEVHKTPDGDYIYKRKVNVNGKGVYKQFRRVQRKNKDGSVKYYWKLADGSDPRPYTFDKPSPPPAS